MFLILKFFLKLLLLHACYRRFVQKLREDSKSVKSRISLKVRTLAGGVNCLHYRMRKISFLKKVLIWLL